MSDAPKLDTRHNPGIVADVRANREFLVSLRALLTG
jgi:hypothetical protein